MKSRISSRAYRASAVRVLMTCLMPAFFAAGAHAADLPIRKAPPPLVAPAFSWTGFYIGLNAGGAFGTSRQDEITNPSTTGNFDVSGGLVGATIGYNVQFNQIVLGAEADFDWANVRGSHACPNNGTPTGFECSTQSDYLGTVRGRFGYAIDNLLLYGTAGVAFGNIKQRFSPPFPPAPAVSYSGASSDRIGPVVGAGIEYALSSNWSVKAEYLYTSLNTFTCGIQCTGVAGEVAKIKLDQNIVRLGVNYHF